MQDDIADQRIDTLKVASLVFYAALSILIAFGTAICIHCTILAMVLPNIWFVSMNITPPAIATSVMLVICVARIRAKSQTRIEFVEHGLELVSKIWYPLLVSLPVAWVAFLVAMSAN
ncbi:hypothetical protein [Pararhizobium sp. DWP1-1-3]|uniref:hypothetical protein n=1 Tax=Pararhizobium sp. DWP1-1-3 TaxID=2804652 RepID=UPI003CF051B3